ncbi:MAG: DUF3822 family protein [Bacteroidia bacterium]|nr:DUF3822 family protein [Bacteroidia bacterium]
MSIPDHHIWFAESQEPEGPFRTQVLLNKPLGEEQRTTCRLVISIEPGKLRYVLLNPLGEWLKAKSFENTGLLSQENFLRFLLEKEKILGEKYVEVQVFLSESSFFLVPDKYHDSRYEAALGRLLIDEQLFGDELLRIPLAFMESQLFMNIQPVLKHILDHYIMDFQLLHPVSTVLSIGYRQAHEEQEVFVLFEGNKVILCLFQEGKLILANHFLCRTEVDVLYYLQLVRQASGFENKHLKAWFMGENRIGNAIHWEVYGIHWEEISLMEMKGSEYDNRQDLTSWRYLVV